VVDDGCLAAERPAVAGDVAPLPREALLDRRVELLGRRENGDSSSPPRTPILQQVKQECSAKSSHLFEVYSQEIRGRIYVENGNIVHAESPGRRGQSAVLSVFDRHFRNYGSKRPFWSFLRHKYTFHKEL